jgi:hypothetical protein
LALGIAVRFLHHALFGGHMLAADSTSWTLPSC